MVQPVGLTREPGGAGLSHRACSRDVVRAGRRGSETGPRVAPDALGPAWVTKWVTAGGDSRAGVLGHLKGGSSAAGNVGARSCTDGLEWFRQSERPRSFGPWWK